MRILFLGDIFGRTGRNAVSRFLFDLKEEYNADICIANCENAAGGFGVTSAVLDELSCCGVDAFTTGNHVWSKPEISGLFGYYNLIRPYNLPRDNPGSGVIILTARGGEKIAVCNLIGNLYLNMTEQNAFFAADKMLEEIGNKTKNILIDFHAEATSEKKALGYYLDGKVSAVIGTHTHIQTADEEIFSGGTAYITDAGMCGAKDSVLGVTKESALSRFIGGKKQNTVAVSRPMINAVFIETDENGHAKKIERIQKF